MKKAISGGLSGLWKHIKEHVGNLSDMVIGGIKDWLVTKIITKAVVKIASMFNPVGAIVQVVLTAWDLYTFLRDQIQRIMGVVKAIVGSITQIAAGAIGNAATMVEGALGALVPVAIDLFAKLLGLGGLGKRIRKVIKKIQGKINNAIKKFINKIKNMFKGKGKKKEKKKEDAKQNGKIGDGEVGETIKFTAGKESHRLWINVKGNSVKVMMASVEKPVADRVRKWRTKLDDPKFLVEIKDGNKDDSKRKKAEQLLTTVEQKLGITQTMAEKTHKKMEEAKEKPSETKENQAKNADDKLENSEEELKTEIATLCVLFEKNDSDDLAEVRNKAFRKHFDGAATKVHDEIGSKGSGWLTKLSKYNFSWSSKKVNERLDNNKEKIIKAGLDAYQKGTPRKADDSSVKRILSKDIWPTAFGLPIESNAKKEVVAKVDNWAKQKDENKKALAGKKPKEVVTSEIGKTSSGLKIKVITEGEMTEEQLLKLIKIYDKIITAAGASTQKTELITLKKSPVTTNKKDKYRKAMRKIVVEKYKYDLPALHQNIISNTSLFDGNNRLPGQIFEEWMQTYHPNLMGASQPYIPKDKSADNQKRLADGFVKGTTKAGGDILTECKAIAKPRKPQGEEISQIASYNANIPGDWLLKQSSGPPISKRFVHVNYTFSNEKCAQMWEEALKEKLSDKVSIYFGDKKLA